MKQHWQLTALLGALLIFLAPGAWAAEGEHFLDDPNSSKYALILVGAAVDQERADAFGQWALGLRNSLQDDYGYASDKITLLMGAAGKNDFNADGPCSADAIRDAFTVLAGKIEQGDQLTVLMIGHGTGRGDSAKFNIVGPDLTGNEFAAMLNTVETSNIVVVNTTSASHDFSKPLAANGRVVVSATRSAAEKYDTVFPEYFVEAIEDHKADRDKNQRVSLLEAFRYANARVDSYFEEKGILPSENASIDDNGDGVFSVNPDQRGDGRLAEIAYLDVVGSANTSLSPAAARLRGEMSGLERDIFLLRANKSALSESEYWTRLEPLLIELAKVTREFNALSMP